MNIYKKLDMKWEAIERMRLLNLDESIVYKFMYENKIMASGKNRIRNLNTIEKQIVKKFEKDNKCIVYHCILDDKLAKNSISLLYVSKDDTEYDMYKHDILDGFVYVYSVNCDKKSINIFQFIKIKLGPKCILELVA